MCVALAQLEEGEGGREERGVVCWTFPSFGPSWDQFKSRFRMFSVIVLKFGLLIMMLYIFSPFTTRLAFF